MCKKFFLFCFSYPPVKLGYFLRLLTEVPFHFPLPGRIFFFFFVILFLELRRAVRQNSHRLTRCHLVGHEFFLFYRSLVCFSYPQTASRLNRFFFLFRPLLGFRSSFSVSGFPPFSQPWKGLFLLRTFQDLALSIGTRLRLPHFPYRFPPLGRRKSSFSASSRLHGMAAISFLWVSSSVAIRSFSFFYRLSRRHRRSFFSSAGGP